jgi:hypothetical protein
MEDENVVDLEKVVKMDMALVVSLNHPIHMEHTLTCLDRAQAQEADGRGLLRGLVGLLQGWNVLCV